MNKKILNFKDRHHLSNAELSKIVCTSTSTIRKYLAPENSAMWRPVNKTVIAIMDYITEKNISVDIPATAKFIKYSPLDFKEHRGEISVAELANILRVDKATVHRWETINDYYEPPAPASKLLFLMNMFGKMCNN